MLHHKLPVIFFSLQRQHITTDKKLPCLLVGTYSPLVGAPPLNCHCTYMLPKMFARSIWVIQRTLFPKFLFLQLVSGALWNITIRKPRLVRNCHAWVCQMMNTNQPQHASVQYWSHCMYVHNSCISCTTFLCSSPVYLRLVIYRTSSPTAVFQTPVWKFQIG